MTYACELVMRDGDTCDAPATWIHTTTGPEGVPDHSYSCHWHANELGDWHDANTGPTRSERIRDMNNNSRSWNVADVVTITLPAEAAHLVYDELQGRHEWLGSTDRNDIRQRVYEALELAMDALDAAGSGPSPLGTYR